VLHISADELEKIISLQSS